MAVKDLKNRKVKSLSIDKGLVEWLEEYSKETNIPQGRIIDEALKLYKDNRIHQKP
jgi:hypothetical protein